MKRKILALFLAVSMVCSVTSCGPKKENQETKPTKEVSIEDSKNQDIDPEKYKKFAQMTPKEIVAELSLRQKVAQMLQPAIYNTSTSEMEKYDFGSVLSKKNGAPPNYTAWQSAVDELQERALISKSGIPFLFGQDDVHGVNYCTGAVIFPQNIGMGAANDPDLMYEVGLATADEAKLCHMLWNFAPVVAQSVDPRWGRTYESYGADLDIIKSLGTSYTKGLIDGGVAACGKHFFADGNVVFGTGENSDVARLIDRGDAQLTDEEIEELLSVYQELVDNGIQTIMISHSSLNGVKMHENGEYIQKLKNEMGFEGFIVSDWNSVQNTSGETYEDQIINCVNAGIDMLMEVETQIEAMDIIIAAVKDGRIEESRIDDAVTRIIRVKQNMGLFDDPMFENLETTQTETGSKEYRDLAEKAVEESLVLIKNEESVLPLKKGQKVYITGPAADNARVQCGGWTLDWNGAPTDDVKGATTILQGFKDKASEYGIEIIDDENKASEADVVVLCVGEESYAEWNGDTEDLELCGALGLEGNADAIKEANELGKPVVTLVVAGRQVIFNSDDYNNWDSVVMCYLPGSEGQGVADVICGGSKFTGKLPSPWYSSVDQITSSEFWLEPGYGLEY